VRFWDSSALVPLIVEEPSSRTLERLLTEDPEVWAWWGTRVECAAAIARRMRQLGANDAAGARAHADLDDLAQAWLEIPSAEGVRNLAVRAVRVHDLRAGHAFQLAAALTASENRPETLELVTLDDRLALAAAREGFRVVSL
jgi:uncharacterized protein